MGTGSGHVYKNRELFDAWPVPVPIFSEDPMTDYTPYQQKIIKRYYDNQDTIQRQRLAELVSELYLAKGKKLQKTWESAAAAMQKLGVPQSRIDHVLKQADPALVAQVVQELEGQR
jgi:hypothetical protein